MDMNPYLNFNDQCAEAFKFYAQVLGGKLDGIMTNGESPTRDHVPQARHHLVMHAQITVGRYVIMGADIPPEIYRGAGNIALTLNYDTAAEAEKVFAALAVGGKINMPMQEMFWAERFGGLTDRFGVAWLINGVLKHMGE